MRMVRVASNEICYLSRRHLMYRHDNCQRLQVIITSLNIQSFSSVTTPLLQCMNAALNFWMSRRVGSIVQRLKLLRHTSLSHDMKSSGMKRYKYAFIACENGRWLQGASVMKPLDSSAPLCCKLHDFIANATVSAHKHSRHCYIVTLLRHEANLESLRDVSIIGLRNIVISTRLWGSF